MSLTRQNGINNGTVLTPPFTPSKKVDHNHMSHSYCPDCGSTAPEDIASSRLTHCCGVEPVGAGFASREKARTIYRDGEDDQ